PNENAIREAGYRDQPESAKAEPGTSVRLGGEQRLRPGADRGLPAGPLVPSPSTRRREPPSTKLSLPFADVLLQVGATRTGRGNTVTTVTTITTVLRQGVAA